MATWPSDVVKYGRSTWTRLRAREKRHVRTAYWSFQAESPEDDEEDVGLWDCDSLIREIHYRHSLERYRVSESVCEEQMWTVFVCPTEIEGGRVGLRDYVLAALGVELGIKFSPLTNLIITAEISYTCFHVRVVDAFMRWNRRSRQCKAACIALLAIGRRRKGTAARIAYAMVADVLRRDDQNSPLWDDLSDTLDYKRVKVELP